MVKCWLLFYEYTYAVGTLGTNRKQMSQLKNVKQIKQGDVDFKHCNNLICCKWHDNKLVLLYLGTLKQWIRVL